jgi:hypothetical protein
MPNDSPLARSISGSTFSRTAIRLPKLKHSTDEQAAVDDVANEADPVVETPLLSDAERALEMIRITLATRPFDLKQ